MDAKKHLWLNSGGGYNSYVSAYLTRLTALGYTHPAPATLAAMNTFLGSISGVLPKKDVLYIMALNNASLANAASINLINPSANQISWIGSPTHLVSGFQGDGTTSYADTNYAPLTQGVQYTLDAASRSAYVYSAAGGTSPIDGSATSGANQMFTLSSGAHRINTTNALSSSIDLLGTGYKALTRIDSTNVNGYSGLTKTSRTATSTSIAAGNQYIGRSGTFYTTSIFSFYSCGGIWTDAEHNLVRNSFVTYLTALGL